MSETKSIKSYSSFVKFLRDHVDEMKRRNPRWSLNVWKRKLDLKSSATLSMILSGSRRPSQKLINKFAEYFQFDNLETDHFHKLVKFDQVGARTRLNWGAQSGNMSSVEALPDLQTQRLLLNPLTFILREMTTLKNFQLDPIWISKKLTQGILPDQITNYIELLKEKDLLKQSKNGQLYAPNQKVSVNLVGIEAVQEFHRKVIDLSQKAVATDLEAERAFQVSYLNIDKSNLPFAKALIQNFQSEFSQYIGTNSGEEVYQLAIQFIPTTKTT